MAWGAPAAAAEAYSPPRSRLTAIRSGCWRIQALRIKGLYLAIATLAGQLIIEWTINHVTFISGGVQASIEVARPRLGRMVLSSQRDMYYFLLFFVVRQNRAGLAAARTLGLFHARSGIVLFLPDDLVVGGDLLAGPDRHPGPGLHKGGETFGKDFPLTEGIATVEFANSEEQLNSASCTGHITQDPAIVTLNRG